MKVPLQFKCNESWTSMEGSGTTRKCTHCDQSVTDLSALTEREARRVLATEPTTCVRYCADRAGHVVFRSCVAMVAAATIALLANRADAQEPGTLADPIEIHLRSFTTPASPTPARPADPGELVFRVVDQDGIEVPRVRVLVRGGHGPVDGLTDESGTVLVEVAPGAYRAEISREGFVPVFLDGIDMPDGAGLSFDLEIRTGPETIFLGQTSRAEFLRAHRRDRLAYREAVRKSRSAARLRGVLTLATDPHRLREVVVRCAGGTRAVVDLWSGWVNIGALPEGRRCSVRAAPGAPPVTFVAGDANEVVTVSAPR